MKGFLLAVVFVAVLFLANALMTGGLVPGFSISPYFLQILSLAGINIILAVSLNLINGITGQFSLGHAGFLAIGAYVSAACTMFLWPQAPGPLALVLALIAGGLAAAVAGLVVGIPALRLRGDYLAIATLGMGEIIRVVILNTEVVGGARGMFGIPLLAGFFSVYACALACVVVLWRLAYSMSSRTDPTGSAGLVTMRATVSKALVIGVRSLRGSRRALFERNRFITRALAEVSMMV